MELCTVNVCVMYVQTMFVPYKMYCTLWCLQMLQKINERVTIGSFDSTHLIEINEINMKNTTVSHVLT